MTIEDQIKDEKLQYDINREAAKISDLSSGKFDKYEYLTGEEILPSNQRQIIEQAKFTYSPLGKAFKKQIKTIEDQGNKQVEALEILKPKEIKPIEEKTPKYSNYFLNGLAKIRESNEPIDYNDLIYYFKGDSAPKHFIEYKGPMHIFKEIHNGDVSLEDTEKEQINFKRNLANIKQGNQKNRSKEQQKTINNATNLYKARQEVVKMFNDYAKNMSRNIYESKQKGTGLKILTPNQILKRLSIALAQIKACNNSESLLNEIRQIVYSLYRSKEITKKVYNKIINSIKV